MKLSSRQVKYVPNTSVSPQDYFLNMECLQEQICSTSVTESTAPLAKHLSPAAPVLCPSTDWVHAYALPPLRAEGTLAFVRWLSKQHPERSARQSDPADMKASISSAIFFCVITFYKEKRNEVRTVLLGSSHKKGLEFTNSERCIQMTAYSTQSRPN